MQLILSIFRNKNSRRIYLSKLGIYIIFLAVIVAFSIINPYFLKVDNIILVLQQAAPLGIVTIGMAFVMATSGIDISVGRNMFFVSAIISFLVANVFPSTMFNSFFGYIVVIILASCFGLLIGLLNGVLVARYNILPFIVTLAVGSIIRGIGLYFTNSATLSMSFFSPIANGKVLGIPNVVIIFFLTLIIFDYVLKRTSYGRYVMAIGNSKIVAQKAGIKVNKIIISTYGLCGVLASIGGLLSSGQIGGVPLSFGEGNEFISITAAVIGGTSLFGGKANIIPGMVFGIVFITMIMNGLAIINASPYVYTIVRGGIIFVAVMLDVLKLKGYVK